MVQSSSRVNTYSPDRAIVFPMLISKANGIQSPNATVIIAKCNRNDRIRIAKCTSDNLNVIRAIQVSGIIVATSFYQNSKQTWLLRIGRSKSNFRTRTESNASSTFFSRSASLVDAGNLWSGEARFDVFFERRHSS
ncbi:hypothetical protein E4T56_gene12453 [Termitomyces sp. T112]|nr:hypothetical protein E4T56_gene12453 [Termitomyces sp. T112]